MANERQPLIRDMDLVRGLLVYIADNGGDNRPVSTPEHHNYSSELISYHLDIMHQYGLFNGTELDNGGWLLRTLTWEGQDFLQAARDHTIWNKAKERAGQHFGALSFEVVKQLLVQVSRQAVGLG